MGGCRLVGEISSLLFQRCTFSFLSLTQDFTFISCRYHVAFVYAGLRFPHSRHWAIYIAIRTCSGCLTI